MCIKHGDEFHSCKVRTGEQWNQKAAMDGPQLEKTQVPGCIWR